MILAKYYLHGIELPSGAWITDLTDTTPATNTEYITEFAAGQFVPSFRGAQSVKPDVGFTTTQIKTILDACGMAGANYAGSNVDLYYRKAINRSTREAIGAAVHLRLRLNYSLLYWERITAAQGQLSQIACRLLGCFDGTNPPIIPAGGQPIGGQQTFTLPYVLGPVSLNLAAAGLVQVPSLNGWTLELNPTIDEEPSDGEDFISWAGIQQHDPVLTCTPRDQAYWDSIGIDGKQVTAAEFFLRKRQADSTRVYANGVAEHVKFSGADAPCGLATVENATGGQPEASQLNLRVGFRISAAASAHPLTVSTGSLIT